MILLISCTGRAQQCAQAIQAATTLPTDCAHSSEEAASLLRAKEYIAVVFDQLAFDAEPESTEQLLEHLGFATPVYVNFAIHGLERVVKQVRIAVNRRKGEDQRSRLSAQRALRSELSDTVTAMLLSCDMVLAERDLPSLAQEKVRTLHELACELSARLGTAEPMA